MTELTSADQRDLITRLYDVHTRMADLAEQERDLKARLRTQLRPGEYTVDQKKALTITPTRRFDPTLAERVLPPDLLDLCRVSKVDSAAAKQVLPPALYAQCSADVGEPAVRLA